MATMKGPSRTKPAANFEATKAHSAPLVRPYFDWDPRKLKLAETMAEQGSLYYAASLCEWLLGDDRVAGTLSARTDQLMGLTPTFEQGTGRRSKQAVKALEAGEDFWEAYPESELTQLVTWGALLGVAPSEQKPWVARPDHGGRMLPSLEFWHPQGLSWDANRRVWTIRDANGGEIEITIGDGTWILHTPYGNERPWAYGLWRSLAPWVLAKQYARADWARHSEKASTLVATSPLEATKTQRKEIAEQIQKIGMDSIVSLANGMDLKLLELTANTRDIYQAQIEMANEAIAIRVRGANLSTNVGKGAGSKAATEAQVKTGDTAKLRFDANAISNTLHDQSLVWWAQFNFGDPRLAPWPAYPVEPEEDKTQRATMVKTLGEGLTAMKKLGFEILEKETKDEFGLTFLGELSEPEPEPVPAPGDDPPPDPGEEDDEAKDKKAKARARSKRLGSGALAALNSGFIEGQEYTDRLVESGVRAGAAELAETLEQVLALIDSVESYAQLEEKLNELYAGTDPERMQEIIERYVMLAELAGRAAVLQDA